MGSSLEQLLAVQDHDIHLDQLKHRKATLPARDAIQAGEQEAAAVEVQLADATSRRDALQRELRRFEDEAQLVEDKAASEDTRLYSGQVTAMKELQALQAEIASLKRRQTDLEDRALAVMESIEPVTAELDQLESRRNDVATQLQALRGQLADEEAQIDAELAQVEADRTASAAEVPAELLAEYERLRVQLGGIAVARLRGTTCDGCHLTLSAMEVDRLKKVPDDAMVPCGECGRILVR